MYPIINNIVLFKNGPLSQWHRCPICISHGVVGPLLSNGTGANKDLQFNCAEQWMMAAKALLFKDFKTYGKIMNSTSPKEQKDLGRQVEGFDKDLWNDVMFEVVYQGNLAKFTQNTELRNHLLDYHHDIIFAEAAPWDTIWGIGLDADDPKAWDVDTWQGQNLLGRVIKQVQMSI